MKLCKNCITTILILLFPVFLAGGSIGFILHDEIKVDNVQDRP